MLKQLELSHEDHIELISYCNSKNSSFFSTAFDVEGVSYLSSLNFRYFQNPKWGVDKLSISEEPLQIQGIQ